MEDKFTASDRDELLSQIYETLKRHEQYLFDLSADVEALKAKLSSTDRLLWFDRAEQAARTRDGDNLATRIRLFDEAIARLRRT